ncbi:hypothetical protein RB195_003137 [Necator americanus]|uniref:Reverse transcriptase domain-containing protein n=1 Tax=Necator americanus TaxID=51031 RepID=A0ABR1DM62_NECAM
MLTEFDETCGCIGLQLNLQKTMFMPNGWISAPFTLNGTSISECTRDSKISPTSAIEDQKRRRVCQGK